MKKQADTKQARQPATTEPVGEIIGAENRTIFLYIEWLTMGIEAIEKLIPRIQKDGLARMSIYDFSPSLENLGRECFISWIEDIEDRCWATREFGSEYAKQNGRYSDMLCRLTRTIEDCFPNSQQARQLAAAIDRLSTEVFFAIQRGVEQYLDGKGKPQPADLLSDTRHGALWDNVENAIIALSTAQAETPLPKNEICTAISDAKGELKQVIDKNAEKIRTDINSRKIKSEAKKVKQDQRERAAKLLEAYFKKNGTYQTLEWAAEKIFEEDRGKGVKGGYANVVSFVSQLYKHVEDLGIDEFIDHDLGRPCKETSGKK